MQFEEPEDYFGFDDPEEILEDIDTSIWEGW